MLPLQGRWHMCQHQGVQARSQQRTLSPGQHGHLACRAESTNGASSSTKDPFAERVAYSDSILDRAMIHLFSSKMKQQLGSKTGKEFTPDYGGFVELSKEITKGKSSEQQQQVIRNVLASLLPPEASARFRQWFPFSKWSAETNAKITKIGFYWLVGDMELEDTEVDFNGRRETWRSAVKIKKCRYLEVSGCKGTCVNMCKRPTEEFFSQEFGLPLTMVPNFEDLSCEMKFGQTPPPFEEDDAYNEPCFQHVCSLADRDASKPCPKIDTERWRRR